MDTKQSRTESEMGREFARYTRTMLMQDEGLKYSPYQDTEGYWTIGVGHYIGEDIKHLKLSWNCIVQQLQDDIDKHLDELYFVFGKEKFQAFARGRQLALLNMMFNLGRERFSKFVNLIAAVNAEQWDKAAAEALDSLWAKQVDRKQTEGGRDNRVSFMLQSGKIHPHYEV